MLLAILAIVVVAIVAALSIASRPSVLANRTFSDEYRRYIGSASWRKRRQKCLALTFGRDALLPWWPATDVDHLSYKNFGREIPWFDTIPLNYRTHRVVTAARMLFGRSLVNIILRTFFALWFAPYIAVVAAGLMLLFPNYTRAVYGQIVVALHYVSLLHG